MTGLPLWHALSRPRPGGASSAGRDRSRRAVGDRRREATSARLANATQARNDKEHDGEWHRIHSTQLPPAQVPAACPGGRAAHDRGRLLRVGIRPFRSRSSLSRMFRLLRGAVVLRLLQHLLAVVAGRVPALSDLCPRAAGRRGAAEQRRTRSAGSAWRTASCPAARSGAAACADAARAAGSGSLRANTRGRADEPRCGHPPPQFSPDLDRGPLHWPAAALKRRLAKTPRRPWRCWAATRCLSESSPS